MESSCARRMSHVAPLMRGKITALSNVCALGIVRVGKPSLLSRCGSIDSMSSFLALISQ